MIRAGTTITGTNGERIGLAPIRAGQVYAETDTGALYIADEVPAWDYFPRLIPGTLTIREATAVNPVLVLQTTDDSLANSILQVQDLAGASIFEINTNSWQNVALGRDAGNSITTGILNVFVGGQVGTSCTSGNGNVGVGHNALVFLSTGIFNFGLGSGALGSLTTGGYNIGIGGNLPLGAITTQSNNVAVGAGALRFSTGASNVGIGEAAGYNCTASFNTFVGWRAGYGLGGAYVGLRNTAIGYASGYNAAGSLCVLIGYNAGYNEGGSNKLYISNSNTATPLIYGEFDTFRLAIGNQYAVDKYGQRTHASGYFAVAGDAQGSAFICRLAQSSHAVNTWYTLYPDGGTAPERLTIAADTAWTVHIEVVGITANAAQQWGYEIIGLIERDNAGNTTLAAQTQRVIFESDANYNAQVAADDINEALEVQVRRTGGVDYDVRWTATIHMAEATYP